MWTACALARAGSSASDCRKGTKAPCTLNSFASMGLRWLTNSCRVCLSRPASHSTTCMQRELGQGLTWRPDTAAKAPSSCRGRADGIYIFVAMIAALIEMAEATLFDAVMMLPLTTQ